MKAELLYRGFQANMAMPGLGLTGLPTKSLTNKDRQDFRSGPAVGPWRPHHRASLDVRGPLWGFLYSASLLFLFIPSSLSVDRCLGVTTSFQAWLRGKMGQAGGCSLLFMTALAPRPRPAPCPLSFIRGEPLWPHWGVCGCGLPSTQNYSETFIRSTFLQCRVMVPFCHPGICGSSCIEQEWVRTGW